MNYPKFYFDQSRPVDLICMGRVAVDLYAEQIGADLKDASSFKKYLGGCAGNIAVGTSRLGLNTQMFSCVGDDEMGQFLRQQLVTEGVNTELLYSTPHHLTGLVLLGIKPPRDFPLIFYRNDCADMQIKASQIDAAHLRQSKALLITGTGLSTVPMRATTMAVINTARHEETAIILDLDYRPVLWGLTASGNGEARYLASDSVTAVYQQFITECDLIVGTEEELCIAGGSNNLEESLATLQQMTAVPIVIKLGEKGARVHFNNGAVLISKPFPVDVLNVLGAGDGFMSGLLSGLLHGQSWELATTLANASGALVVTRHGCAPAIPYLDELHYFIQHYDQNSKVSESSALAQLHDKNQKQPMLIKNSIGFNHGLNLIVPVDSDAGMGFSSLRLNKGQNYTFNFQYEFAALLMTGKVTFHFAQQEKTVQRYDYFSQAPIVLHCPRGEQAMALALSDCEILLIETENNNHFAAHLFTESTLLEVDNRGQGILDDTSYRIVRTVFDKRNRPQSNLVVGEIITFQGRWSSYPSHYHKQPEIYHYRFSEPQGYAFGENGKEVLRIEHYDTYQITEGQEHAHCTAPGYALYTLWFIKHLQEEAYRAPTFRTQHEWTRFANANARVWQSLEHQ